MNDLKKINEHILGYKRSKIFTSDIHSVVHVLTRLDKSLSVCSDLCVGLSLLGNCDVELLQNTHKGNISLYVYKITNITDESYILHQGARNLIIFK